MNSVYAFSCWYSSRGQWNSMALLRLWLCLATRLPFLKGASAGCQGGATPALQEDRFPTHWGLSSYPSCHPPGVTAQSLLMETLHRAWSVLAITQEARMHARCGIIIYFISNPTNVLTAKTTLSSFRVLLHWDNLFRVHVFEEGWLSIQLVWTE